MSSDNPQFDPKLAQTSELPSRQNPAETAALPPDTGFSVSQPSSAPVAAEAWVGRMFGKYQVTAVLGQGAMGVVLKARDPLIERDVAIKVLAPHLAADATARERFLAEARAAGKINHPNVIAIYEISESADSHHLILEFVPGGSLGDAAGTQGCSLLEATRAMCDACLGAGAAHAAGLVHRDLKPANLMRAADGSIKVADFGLAKVAVDSGRGFTQAGMVIGTPFFMSPEQCEAKPLDPRSDIYSLGATYYSLLTGRHPYEETENIPQLMYLHCHGEIPDPRSVNPSIPEACSRIVARAMAKAPADRYPSAGQMLADLQAVLATLSGQTRIELPSESGVQRALQTSAARATAATLTTQAATTVNAAIPPAPPRTRRAWLAGGFFCLALAALAVFFWRPWQKVAPRSSGTPGLAPVAAAAGEPVKVGVLHSLSGTMANSESPVVDAVLFAIDEVNAAGGVMGRPLKGVVADGRSDSDTFAREAERLIADEKVASLFGCWTSASRKTVRPVIEAHDQLLVYPLQFEGLETSPNIVYIGAAPNQQILPTLPWAMKTLGKKRFFIVGSDYIFPRAAGAIIKDALRSVGGALVGEEYVLLGGQDFEAVVSAILKAKPDVILNTINGDSNMAFFRALRAAGVASDKVPIISFSIGEQELRSLNAADVAGDFAAWTYFQEIDTPENKDFVRRFQEKYPQRLISDPMESAYLGVKMWAAAANDAQSLEPKKIRRAMLAQRFKAAGGDVRLDSDTQYCYRTPRIAQIQPDGRFKVVWTAPAPVRPEPYPSSRTAEAWQAMLHDLYTGWGNQWAAPADRPGSGRR